MRPYKRARTLNFLSPISSNEKAEPVEWINRLKERALNVLAKNESPRQEEPSSWLSPSQHPVDWKTGSPGDIGEHGTSMMLYSDSADEYQLPSDPFNSQILASSPIQVEDNASEHSFVLNNELEYDLIDSNTVEHDLIESDTIEGDLINSDAIEGDLINSDAIEGDLVETDTIKGDLIKSDAEDDGILTLVNEDNDKAQSNTEEDDLIKSDAEDDLIKSDTEDDDILKLVNEDNGKAPFNSEAEDLIKSDTEDDLIESDAIEDESAVPNVQENDLIESIVLENKPTETNVQDSVEAQFQKDDLIQNNSLRSSPTPGENLEPQLDEHETSSYASFSDDMMGNDKIESNMHEDDTLLNIGKAMGAAKELQHPDSILDSMYESAIEDAEFSVIGKEDPTETKKPSFDSYKFILTSFELEAFNHADIPVPRERLAELVAEVRPKVTLEMLEMHLTEKHVSDESRHSFKFTEIEEEIAELKLPKRKKKKKVKQPVEEEIFKITYSKPFRPAIPLRVLRKAKGCGKYNHRPRDPLPVAQLLPMLVVKENEVPPHPFSSSASNQLQFLPR